MVLNISHLVIIGCSCSYGDELPDPKTQSWAALLGKKLGVPVVNLSTKGGGNDRIHRRLAEYHYKDSTYDNFPLYIIAYSHSSRREEYSLECDDYVVVNVNLAPDWKNDSIGFAAPCILNYNNIIQSRKKLLIQNSVLNFLKLSGKSFLVTDFMPDDHIARLYLKDKFSNMYDDIVSDTNRLSDFAELVTGLPMFSHGHPGHEAQHLLSEYTYNELLRRYDRINVIDAPFTTLVEYNEYYDNTTGHSFNDWI